MYNIFTEFNLLEYIEILVSGYNPNHSKVWGCLLEVIVVFLCTHNASVLKITNYVFTIHGFHVCIMYSYFAKNCDKRCIVLKMKISLRLCIFFKTPLRSHCTSYLKCKVIKCHNMNVIIKL